ncbi:MAG TPA: hypothetical protein VLZ53_10950 [Devosia sp.]|nr:hypothetical protein [Devosia sp.]
MANYLGNTATICRKCYVHPDVVQAYLDGTLHDELNSSGGAEAPEPGLKPEEVAVLALMKNRLGKN